MARLKLDASRVDDVRSQAKGNKEADAPVGSDRRARPSSSADPAVPLSSLQQKEQATDRALRALGQTQHTMSEVALASGGRSTALPHLRDSVLAARQDLQTALDSEVNARLAESSAGGKLGDGGYAKAVQAITQRHVANAADVAVLEQVALLKTQTPATADGQASQAPGRADAQEPDLATAEGMAQAFSDMQGKTPQEQQEAADAARQLRDGSAEEKTQALTTLTRFLSDADIDRLGQKLKVDDDKTVMSLRHDQKACDAMRALADPHASLSARTDAAITLANRLDALNLMPGRVGEALKPFLGNLTDAQGMVDAYNTLSSPDASAGEKVKAALSLTEALGKQAPGQLREALQPYLKSLPAAQGLISAIEAWANPEASALDKAKASLNLVKAIKTSVGDLLDIKNDLRFADSTLNSLGHALTLLDPSASWQDKAQAALGLTAQAPQIAGDLAALKAFLTKQGVSADDTTRIADAVGSLPVNDRLPKRVSDALGSDVTAQLTAEQADQLSKQYAKHGDDFVGALGGLSRSGSVTELMKALDGVADDKAAKGMLEALTGLKPGLADELLGSAIEGGSASQVLSRVFNELDGSEAKKLASMLADTDIKSLRFALHLGDVAGGTALKEVLGAVGDGKIAGQALSAVAQMLDGTAIKITAKVAPQILQGIAKAVPVAGAIPAGVDAVRMAQIAADANMPADIRYLAQQAAKLNGADAVLSVAEPFIAGAFAIPVAVDILIAVAGVALDVLISHQIEQFEQAQQDGTPYQSPDWLKVVTVSMATAQGPQGMMELALAYGPEGATELLGSVARMGGSIALKAVELQQTMLAQGLGAGMQLTADGLHTLADIIRNPGKYGEAAGQMVNNALGKLNEVAQGVGEFAAQAGKQLEEAVDYLKDLGAQGIEALKWIASNPGKAAERAVNALSDMAQQGLALATEAGRQLAQGALDALTTAHDALQSAGKAAQAALDAAGQALTDVVNDAMAAGKKGLETLAWIASNPGKAADIARQGLMDVMAKGGELAQQAWDQVVGLGQQGVELAKDMANRLKDVGEAGVKLLQYVVQNPGEAAQAVRQAALDGLAAVAKGVGDAAKAATQALTDFVDSGVEQAKQTVTHLLVEGGEVAGRIMETLGHNLSEGGKAVIEGLKDLGDAGADALGKLAEGGILFAQDVVHDLAETGAGWAQDVRNHVKQTWPWVPIP